MTVKYYEDLNKLIMFYFKIERRREELSEDDQQAEQIEIDGLFEQVKEKVNKYNVSKESFGFTLLELAAYFGRTDIIKYLLANHLIIILEQPIQLGRAIYWAARKDHHLALEKLLDNSYVLEKVISKTPDQLCWAIDWASGESHHRALELLLKKPIIVEKVINKNPEKLADAIKKAARNGNNQILKLLLKQPLIFQLISNKSGIILNIEKNIKQLQQDEDFKIHAIKYLKIINRLKNWNAANAAAKEAMIPIVFYGAAFTIATGTFVSALLAKKGINLFKDTRLVTNYLFPAFNKINNRITKISSHLDLNELTKALTNPKEAGLLILFIAILGVMNAIVHGAIAYEAQGGSFSLGS